MPVKVKERGSESPKAAAEEFVRRLKSLGALFGGAYSAYADEDPLDLLLPKGEDGGGEGGGRCR